MKLFIEFNNYFPIFTCLYTTECGFVFLGGYILHCWCNYLLLKLHLYSTLVYIKYHCPTLIKPHDYVILVVMYTQQISCYNLWLHSPGSDTQQISCYNLWLHSPGSDTQQISCYNLWLHSPGSDTQQISCYNPWLHSPGSDTQQISCYNPWLHSPGSDTQQISCYNPWLIALTR